MERALDAADLTLFRDTLLRPELYLDLFSLQNVFMIAGTSVEMPPTPSHLPAVPTDQVTVLTTAMVLEVVRREYVGLGVDPDTLSYEGRLSSSCGPRGGVASYPHQAPRTTWLRAMVPAS